jgi:hypothetical protein
VDRVDAMDGMDFNTPVRKVQRVAFVWPLQLKQRPAATLPPFGRAFRQLGQTRVKPKISG